MRPNVEFWVNLLKTNLGLAKSHLQKSHGYEQKTASDSSSYPKFLSKIAVYFILSVYIKRIQKINYCFFSVKNTYKLINQ